MPEFTFLVHMQNENVGLVNLLNCYLNYLVCKSLASLSLSLSFYYGKISHVPKTHIIYKQIK